MPEFFSLGATFAETNELLRQTTASAEDKPTCNRERALKLQTPKPVPVKVTDIAEVDKKSAPCPELLLRAMMLGVSEIFDTKLATALLTIVKANTRRS